MNNTIIHNNRRAKSKMPERRTTKNILLSVDIPPMRNSSSSASLLESLDGAFVGLGVGTLLGE